MQSEAKYSTIVTDELIADSSIHEVQQNASTQRRKYLRGWRAGILSGFTLSMVVLTLNIAGLAYVKSSKGRGASKFSRNTLKESDCASIRKLNVGIHLIINILSSVLLGASNYGMQCLSAPSRSEVDIAHSKKQWLDIGIPSLKNLKSISRTHKILWIMLAASSLPLHLMYNSTVYSTLVLNDYLVYYTDEQTMKTPGAIIPSFPANVSEMGPALLAVRQQMMNMAASGQLVHLNEKECVQAYGIPFQSQHGNVIAIANGSIFGGNSPYEYWPPVYNFYNNTLGAGTGGMNADPGFWLCGPGGTGVRFPGSGACWKSIRKIWDSVDEGDWTFGYIWESPNRTEVWASMTGCLSEPLTEVCRLEFAPEIAIIVIICNIIKCVALICICLLVTDNPLLTIGDAITTFIKRPDTTTAGYCLLDKTQIDTWKQLPLARQFSRRVLRLSAVPSRRRWKLFILLSVLILSFCLGLLIFGLEHNNSSSASAQLALGLGEAPPEMYIQGSGWLLPDHGYAALFANVLVANSPQLILSILYYTYNGLITNFCLAREWARFATQRKGLRVSAYAEGVQRTTYFLQLPYRFAIPVMIMSIVLHWLCSQSIFLISTQVHTVESRFQDSLRNISAASLKNWKVADPDPRYFSCGYSAVAVLCAFIIGLLMVVLLIAVSRLKLESTIPLASSCSAVISAACHPPDKEDGQLAAASAVKWGACSEEADTATVGEESIHHCSFSSLEVTEPIEKQLYAGLGR